jgi:hypothetical protein
MHWHVMFGEALKCTLDIKFINNWTSHVAEAMQELHLACVRKSGTEQANRTNGTPAPKW